MKVHIGVKSDPIECRYSFEWLFDLMRSVDVHRLQLGSSFPVFFADDAYFRGLRRVAENRGVLISSMFGSHRELGGFGSGDSLIEEATHRGWERMIHVAALVGAETVGSNANITPRDQPSLKLPGTQCFLAHIRELMKTARRAGLKALTVEPMSSVYEMPSTPDEVRLIEDELGPYHARNAATTVPLLLCGDISHGVADVDGRVVHDNWSMFEMEIPWMFEFHFKNTDAIFNATFGFGPEENTRGIVDLRRLKRLIDDNEASFPVREITGYLEIGGPKIGREYADGALEGMLVESLEALEAVFG